MISAPLNGQSERIYHRLGNWLRGMQATTLHPEDRPIELGDAEVIILGMGRIGQGAYFELENKYGTVILGVENDSEKLPTLRAQGMNVIEGTPPIPTSGTRCCSPTRSTWCFWPCLTTRATSTPSRNCAATALLARLPPSSASG